MNPPDVGTVFRHTVQDLRRHLGRHLVASLPMLAVWVLFTSAIYALEFASIPPIYTAWFWMEDELVSTVAYVLIAFVVLPVVATVVPFVPLYVGMLHAQRAWIDHEEPLRLTSTLSWAGVALVPAAITVVPVWMLESAVWSAGILPAVVVEAVFGFGVAAVVVHRLRPTAAIHLSVAHFLHAPLWRLKFAGMLMLVSLVCGFTLLPMLLLPAFNANATIRAYRAWYGTDPLPRPL